MKRTKLSDRLLPDKSFLNHDAYQIVSAFIYGFSMIILYTMSSVYHGLVPKTAFLCSCC